MQVAEDPRLARVREVFDTWAKSGRAVEMERHHAPVARQAFDRLGLPQDGWYLDVGSGNGYTVRWAALAAPGGWAVGVDVSPRMVESARRMSAAFANVEFQVAPFPSTRLPHGCFDAVFTMEVLHYLPDLDLALREIGALLVPGGRLACVVDYYVENEASHSWPDEVGLPMTLLDEAGWRTAIEGVGLSVLEQARLRVPAELASQPWKATEGSLLTLAERPER